MKALKNYVQKKIANSRNGYLNVSIRFDKDEAFEKISKIIKRITLLLTYNSYGVYVQDQVGAKPNSGHRRVSGRNFRPLTPRKFSKSEL